METVLYADVLFLVNFAMDFISLSAAASLGSVAKKPLRISVASALGAFYGVVATASGLGGILQYILAAAVGGAMCAVGFGFSGIISFIRQCIIFWGCGALLGGVMTAVLSMGNINFSPSYFIPICSAAATVLFFTIRAITARAGTKSIKMTVTYKGKTAVFDALSDSGNFLRDPFSGKPVVTVSAEELRLLLPENIIGALLSCDAEYLAARGMSPRIIPRGGENGPVLLCGFAPDKATAAVGTRSAEKDILIALSPHSKTYYAGFPATAPSVLAP